MDEYIKIHRQAVDKLRELGVHYSYDSRLALFWLRHNIPKLYDGEKMIEVIELIDILVAMRTQGLEPSHENGRYL